MKEEAKMVYLLECLQKTPPPVRGSVRFIFSLVIMFLMFVLLLLLLLLLLFHVTLLERGHTMFKR